MKKTKFINKTNHVPESIDRTILKKLLFVDGDQEEQEGQGELILGEIKQDNLTQRVIFDNLISLELINKNYCSSGLDLMHGMFRQELVIYLGDWNAGFFNANQL